MDQASRKEARLRRGGLGRLLAAPTTQAVGVQVARGKPATETGGGWSKLCGGLPLKKLIYIKEPAC